MFNRLIVLALTTRLRHVCNKFLSTLPSLSNHYQHLCLQCKCILAFALTTLSLVHNNRPRVLATVILNIGQLLPDTLRELANLAVRTIKRDNQILVHVVNSRHRRDDCSSTRAKDLENTAFLAGLLLLLHTNIVLRNLKLIPLTCQVQNRVPLNIRKNITARKRWCNELFLTLFVDPVNKHVHSADFCDLMVTSKDPQILRITLFACSVL